MARRRRSNGNRSGAPGGLAALRRVMTLVIPLVLVCGVSYWFYIDSQEKYLTARNYRVLATAAKQIIARFSGFRSAMATRAALKDDSKEPGLRRTRTNLYFYDGDDKPKKAGCVETPTLLKLSSDITVALSNDVESPSFCLEYETKQNGTKTSASANVGIFLNPILDREEFDDVLLLDGEDRVIYQRGGSSSVRAASLEMFLQGAEDTLAEQTKKAPESSDKSSKAEAGDTARGKPRFAEPRPTNYQGEKFLLFFQPVPLAPSSGSEKGEWLLCGVVRTSRFHHEQRQVSPWFVLALAILIAVVALAWPALKLRYMGPRERLRMIDVRILVLSVIGTAGVVTFAALAFHAYLFLSADLDRELLRLASRLEENFRREVAAAFRQVDALAQTYRPVAESTDPNWQEIDQKLNREGITYPYFTDLIVTDDGGKLRRAWRILASGPATGESGNGDGRRELSVENYELKQDLDFSDRGYFKSIKKGRLANFGANGDQRLAIEPVQAKTSGERTVAIAVPVDQEKWSGVAAIGIPLISMIKPVLPMGFRFAVVDEDGEAIFHSDAKRNQQENFFVECGGLSELRAAVTARRASFVNAPYFGRAHHMYVHPLRDTEWTLIVFRDSARLNALFTHAAAAWGLLFATYLAVYLLGAALVSLFRPGYRAEWLWPLDGNAAAYSRAALILSALLITMTVIVATNDDALGTYVALLTTPALAGALLYLTLNDIAKLEASRRRLAIAVLAIATGLVAIAVVRPSVRTLDWIPSIALAFGAAGVARAWRYGGGAKPGSEDGWQYRYFSMLFFLLFAVAVVPSVAFFNDVYNAHFSAFVRAGQLHFARAMLDREDRLEQEFYEARAPNTFKKRLHDKRDVYRAAPFVKSYRFIKAETSIAAQCDGWLCAAVCDGGESAERENTDRDACVEFLSALRRNVSTPIVSTIPWFGDSTDDPRKMSYERASDDAWRFDADRDGTKGPKLHDARWKTRRSAGAEQALEIVGPSRASASTMRWRVVAILLLLGLAAILLSFYAFAGVVNQLFLLDLDDSAAPWHVWLYVFQPSLPTPPAARPKRFTRLNLRTLAMPDDCAAWPDTEACRRAEGIVIDHFEAQLDSPAWNTAKLELLERMVARGRQPIIVCSTVDIEECAAGDPGGSFGSKERWSALLTRFAKEPWDGTTASGAIAKIRNERLWEESPVGDKLALAQLVEEGFLNPNNDEVNRRLFRRGVIWRKPAIRVDDDFRDYIKDHTQAGEIRTWERSAGPSDWERVRTPLAVSVLAVIGFFIITQRETVNWLLGIVTAAAATVPVLLRFVEMLGRPRGSNESS